MKTSSARRRVPRKIGADDDEADHSADLTQEDTASTIKRPIVKTKRSSQTQRFSAAADDEETSGGVVTPKRTNLSRIALHRTAGQRSSFLASELPRTPDTDDVAATYSAADLQSLKDSTPSTPRPDAEQSNALDLGDKFGTALARYEQSQSSTIPSAAEIAEKKARRARLALESKAEEYISLDPDDPGWEEDDDGNAVKDADGRLVLREKDKYRIQESRLVRDDEDIMEGFDEFTGDTGSKIIMGASARPEDKQARRQDIAEQIARAENASEDDDSDPDEKMRNAAFEAAQTKHGQYADDKAAKEDPYAEYRAKTPPIITPLPDLQTVLARIRASVTDLEEQKRVKVSEMEQLTKEKFRIRDEEARVQAQLKEVAENFRHLKMERGFLPKDTLSNVEDNRVPDERLGASDAKAHSVSGQKGVAEEDADEYIERPGIGLGAG